MISRHYVNKPNCNDEKTWGIVYCTAEEAKAAESLDSYYHIEERGPGETADGRWYLLIDRSEFQSDDIAYLEMLLRLYIMEEHHGPEIADDYGVMAPGYQFGWIVADGGPYPWDDDYGKPISQRIYIDKSPALEVLKQMQNVNGRNLCLMPVAWDPTDGTNEFVCCSISPCRITMPREKSEDEQTIDRLNAGLKALDLLLEYTGTDGFDDPLQSLIEEYRPLKDKSIEVDFLGREAEDPDVGFMSIVYIDYPHDK